jgi:predicted  nucleic acid-binding Zn-ribbon protein
MSDIFRPVFEGLKQTAEGLVQVNLGIKNLAQAIMDANSEYQDQGETITRIEHKLMAQGVKHTAEITRHTAEIAELRDEIRHLREHLGGELK